MNTALLAHSATAVLKTALSVLLMWLLTSGYSVVCGSTSECVDASRPIEIFSNGVLLLLISPFTLLYFPYQLALLLMGYEGRRYYLLVPMIGVLLSLAVFSFLTFSRGEKMSFVDWAGFLAALPVALTFLVPNLLILQLKLLSISPMRNR